MARHGVRLVQWAQHPGPVGGVTRSVDDLTAALRRTGVDVRHVDTGSARRALAAVPALWLPRSLHLFHITRVWRAILLAPVFAVLPGRTVLVLHSGSVRRQLETQPRWRSRLLGLSLPAYDRIWAVNADIRAALPPRLRRRVLVVSPFVPAAALGADPGEVGTARGSAPGSVRREPHLVTVATNSGHEHYHAEMAVEAVRLVRRVPEWADARLWILGYDQDGPAMANLRARIAGEDWITLSFNLSGPEASRALARSGVFLRPTSWDGDSLIVREALALGARVVASDTAARPAGTELCELSPDAIARAVVHRGSVSDGSGVAAHSILDAAHSALTEVSTR